MLVSVLPHARVFAWRPDADPDQRFERTQVMALEAALSREFDTDAHVVSYVADHRVRKEDAAAYGDLRAQVLFADVDVLPKGVSWDADSLREMLRAWPAVAERLGTVGMYTTRRGYRLVQPLAAPLDVLTFERTLWAWLATLAAAGIAYDPACKDWTRLFRLPNVRRDGVLTDTAVDYTRMRSIALAPLDVAPHAPRAVRKPRARLARTVQHTPTAWTARLRPVSAALGSIDHTTALAVAGGLLQLGAAPEDVPALVRELSELADPGRNHLDRELAASTTVDRWARQLPVTGLRSLPMLAQQALEEACRPAPEVAAAPEPVDLVRAIAHAPPGVTVVSVECGGGKTRAALEVAAARATSKPAKDKRESANVRTVLSVPTHALVQQLGGDLAALGVPTRRRLGVLAHPDGCHYAELARPLVAGGQSINRELCEGRGKMRCDHYDHCDARLGIVGDPDARVTLTVHNILKAEAERVGPTGLVVIDEPPPLFKTAILTAETLSTTLSVLADHRFEKAYSAQLVPVLEELLAWCSGADDEPAILPAQLHEAPPLEWDAIRAIRYTKGLSKRLGDASGVLRDVQSAIHWQRHRRTEADSWYVVLVRRDEELVTVLEREGRTVLTDAGAEAHIPAITKALGAEPAQVRAALPDGAPIERTHLRLAGATRRQLLGRHLDAEEAAKERQRVARALDAALTWGAGERLLLVSYRGLLQRADVQDRLARYPGVVETIHYGAVRGRNDWANVDAVVTLGDPRPSLSSTEAVADVVGVDTDHLVQLATRVELEQAHGRMRTPHRRRPGRAAHVGLVLPGGWGWEPGSERFHVVDVVEADLAARVAEEGLGAVARSLGVTPDALRKRIARG